MQAPWPGIEMGTLQLYGLHIDHQATGVPCSKIKLPDGIVPDDKLVRLKIPSCTSAFSFAHLYFQMSEILQQQSCEVHVRGDKETQRRVGEL